MGAQGKRAWGGRFLGNDRRAGRGKGVRWAEAAARGKLGSPKMHKIRRPVTAPSPLKQRDRGAARDVGRGRRRPTRHPHSQAEEAGLPWSQGEPPEARKP